MDQHRSVGSLGPRLAGRLTAELILRSRQYMSCIHLYEIDLRGNKIAAIENLGATENQFDSIDLSDNAIVKLEGFPRLSRLKQLLINNNRVTRIDRNVAETIPNVECIILTNNRINNLQDLDPLSSFPKLKMISLTGNPVTTKPSYRLYVISKCKGLKILDFKKVKAQERKEAEKLYPNDEAAAQAAAKTFEPDEDLQAAQAQAGVSNDAEMSEASTAQASKSTSKGPTAQQLVAVKAAIANAATLEEIQRLEAALTTGQLPSEFDVESGTGAAANTSNGEQQPEAMQVG
jgi:U2 small nuclear ribonucleoprotein A'